MARPAHCCVIPALMLVFTGSPAVAQHISVQPGARLRLTLTGDTVVIGRLQRSTRDSVVIRDDASQVAFARSNILRTEVEASGQLFKPVVGAIVGGVAGVLFGNTWGEKKTSPSPPCNVVTDSQCKIEFDINVAPVLFGLLGAVIGGIAGASLADGWTTAPGEGRTVGLTVDHSGRVGIATRFTMF